MMNTIQGMVAAGTVAYLTYEPSWEKIALGTNYLFYLVGIARQAAQVEIPNFSLAAKWVFMLTPVVLIGPFLKEGIKLPFGENLEKRLSPIAENLGKQFQRFLYVASAVSTLVLMGKGEVSYGIGFFSVVALDIASRYSGDEIKNIFKTLFGITAIFSFASYGLKLATLRGQGLMLVTTGEVFIPKIWKIIQSFIGRSGGSSSHQRGYSSYGMGYYPFKPTESNWSNDPVPPKKPTQPPSQSGGGMQALKNLTGALPHDL